MSSNSIEENFRQGSKSFHKLPTSRVAFGARSGVFAALLAVSMLGLSSCGLASSGDSAQPTSTVSASPTATNAANVCSPVQTDSGDRLPIVIDKATATSDGWKTTIVINLSGPISKNVFDRGLGSAATREYGFQIGAPSGALVNYSFRNDIGTVFDENGQPVVRDGVADQIKFEFDASTVTISFPTAAINFKDNDYAVQMFLVGAGENSLTGDSVCAAGSDAISKLTRIAPTSTDSPSS